MQIRNNLEKELLFLRRSLILLNPKLIKEFIAILFVLLMAQAMLLISGLFTAFLSVTILVIATIISLAISKPVAIVTIVTIFIVTLFLIARVDKIIKAEQFEVLEAEIIEAKKLSIIQTNAILFMSSLIVVIALIFEIPGMTFWELLTRVGLLGLLVGCGILGIGVKFTEMKINYSQKTSDHNSTFVYLIKKISPEAWNKTSESFHDTIDTIPDEIIIWEKRNLKYVAYLVIAWDLLGFFRYFLKTIIKNAIATRRVSS